MTPVDPIFALEVLRVQRVRQSGLWRRLTPTAAGWCDTCCVLSLVDEERRTA